MSMTRNILILNNELCQYHFTGERSEVFHLSWLSENEMNYPSNSPEMVVLKSLAYRKSEQHLYRIAKDSVAEQLYREIREDITIKDIHRVESTTDSIVLGLLFISKGKQVKEKFTLEQHGDSWTIVEWQGGANKSFFESADYEIILLECKASYEPYRITNAYIEYQYKLSNIQWHDAFKFTGGKERWGHHNVFTQNYWNKFPSRNLRMLRFSEMELFNISINDVLKAVALDDIEFDKAISNERPPEFYFEYSLFCPIRKVIPKCSTVQEAIEYVNGLPYPDNVKLRWVDNYPYRDIVFDRDRSYSSSFYRSACKVRKDMIEFKSPSRIAPTISMRGKRIDITLSE